MNIKIATIKDLKFLVENDKHISENEFINLLNLERVYIVEYENQNIGWLRYNLFWDNIPFMNMLYFLPNYRRKGFGKKLVEYWEKQMKELNFTIIMTSSMSDEQAQHFYRKLSYKDSGALLLENEALEIIFTKSI